MTIEVRTNLSYKERKNIRCNESIEKEKGKTKSKVILSVLHICRRNFGALRVRKKEHCDAIRLGQSSKSAIVEHVHEQSMPHEIDWQA